MGKSSVAYGSISIYGYTDYPGNLYIPSFVQNHPGLFIWGAGAKGSSFVNLMDPHCSRISYVVDVNPKKQGRYIAKTGHKIVPPESLNDFGGGDILVMNENYYEEIRKDVATLNFNLYSLGIR